MTAAAIGKTLLQVRAAQGGDRDALEALFTRYLPRVRRIAAVRAGKRLRAIEDQEDLVQDALLKAFQSLGQFEHRGEGSFCNWLASCVQSRLTDRLREASARKRGEGKVRRFSELGTETLSFSIFGANVPTPSKLLQAQELEEKVEAALLALARHHREAITLRCLCGMTYGEVAEAMGFDQETSARKAVSRAVKRLREEVGLP